MILPVSLVLCLRSVSDAGWFIEVQVELDCRLDSYHGETTRSWTRGISTVWLTQKTICLIQSVPRVIKHGSVDEKVWLLVDLLMNNPWFICECGGKHGKEENRHRLWRLNLWPVHTERNQQETPDTWSLNPDYWYEWPLILESLCNPHITSGQELSYSDKYIFRKFVSPTFTSFQSNRLSPFLNRSVSLLLFTQ